MAMKSIRKTADLCCSLFIKSRDFFNVMCSTNDGHKVGGYNGSHKEVFEWDQRSGMTLSDALKIASR